MDFAITREDASSFLHLLQEFDSDVFLLIKPNEGGPPAGGFIIREDGRILSDQALCAIPPGRDDGRTGSPRDSGPSSASGTGVATSTAAATGGADRAIGGARPVSWRARARIWVVAAAVTALSVGLFFAIPRHVPGVAPVKPGPSPALSVTKAETVSGCPGTINCRVVADMPCCGLRTGKRRSDWNSMRSS